MISPAIKFSPRLRAPQNQLCFGASRAATVNRGDPIPPDEPVSRWRLWPRLRTIILKAWVALKIMAMVVLASFFPVKAVHKRVEAALLYNAKGVSSLANLRDASLSKKLTEIRFQSLDGTKLTGWYAPPTKPGMPTVLYAQGMNAIMEDTEDVIRALLKRGYGYMGFDYRGYGKSEGKPSEVGLTQDLEAASRYLLRARRVPVNQQILMGNSLGGAVVLNVASQTQLPYRALVVVSSFTRLTDVVSRVKERFFIPKWVFNAEAHMEQRYPSIDRIGQITQPLLICHGTQDSLVPYEMGKSLFQAAKQAEHKRFLRVNGASHLNMFYVAPQAIMDQLDALLKQSA